MDEDPDMDGWSDFVDDENDEDGNLEGENDNDDDEYDSADLGMDNNKDALTDAASSDEDEGGDVCGALEGGDDSGGGSDEDDSYSEQGEREKTKMSPFADTDEYEKLLEEELNNQLRENEDI